MSADIPELTYHQGTVKINGSISVPYAYWDERSKTFRANGLYYKNIINYLKESSIEYNDSVPNPVPCPELKELYDDDIQLRDYQQDAISSWIQNNYQGVIVLPTGSGKTIIGLEAIAYCNTPVIVVVPTIDLMEQWCSILSKAFSIEIGSLGGGKKDIQPITVSTYDSAYIHAEKIGNQFNFIIFDEVHHLPAEGYRTIAEMFIAPYRMGLTATYEREDGLHKELNRLVGGKVFEQELSSLSGKHLSPYRIEKITVALKEEEKKEYKRNHSIFTDYLKKKNISMKSPGDFQKLVIRSGNDPEARKALLARNRARDIAFNSSAKVEKLRDILKKHIHDFVFIFTEHNHLVYRISDEFLIPSITYKTTARERNLILEKFKSGTYNAIVTSKVLDEGIDVPEASVGVILSGTGSKREYIQRLGRILRKQKGKEAVLYEIVSAETSEINTSKRRKPAQ
ncbi:DEAD/DEAH box helicase family protein [Methanohalobium sp.]|uniref:DEAD/DEAH box helicase family protein n=1 Tax=Methanohalobium sp. TaxID=2837493 RepID=UPI0025FF9DE2|nr:DEAD/DEAH box helicase family protein [Methanohalobium sp.]